MANSTLTDKIVTFESLELLLNDLQIPRNINTDYNDQFGQEGAKAGDTIQIRIPYRSLGRDGQAVNIEPLTDLSTPLSLNMQFGADAQFGSAEMYTSLDNMRERYLRPQMEQIANKVDRSLHILMASTCNNVVGTPGTAATTLATYLAAKTKLKQNLAIGKKFPLVLNSQQDSNIVGALTGLYNPQPQISGQYIEGEMRDAVGFGWMESENVVIATVGTYGGSPVVNGANQMGSNLITNGWSSGATSLNMGDVFTIAGVYMVNAQNRSSIGVLQQFLVTAPVSDTSGAITIPISPPIVPSGQYQNVSAVPATGAALTMWGTSGTNTTQALAFHRNAYTLCWGNLEMPGGIDQGWKAVDPKTKVALRFVRDYIIQSDQRISRFDVLMGAAPLYPFWAVRVATN
jgi:hypothetical protein